MGDNLASIVADVSSYAATFDSSDRLATFSFNNDNDVATLTCELYHGSNTQSLLHHIVGFAVTMYDDKVTIARIYPPLRHVEVNSIDFDSVTVDVRTYDVVVGEVISNDIYGDYISMLSSVASQIHIFMYMYVNLCVMTDPQDELEQLVVSIIDADLSSREDVGVHMNSYIAHVANMLDEYRQ
jgi:hypothetical protein